MPRISDFCLSYCTNVHPSEKLGQMRASLVEFTRPLKDKLFPSQPMGLGIWMASEAADSLHSSLGEFENFEHFLAQNDFFLFTVNAFPYGNFHSRRVKEQVYVPDWTQPERVAYTCRVADLLARLLPPDLTGSISTLSGAFRPLRHDPETFQSIARRLAQVVAHLHRLETRSGKHIQLGIEPEPWTTLESTTEARLFFKDYVYRTGAAVLAADLATDAVNAERLLRRHLGLCFDCCHQAVQFEDLKDSLKRLAADGIPIAKVHLSCALSVPNPGKNPDGVAELLSFDEERYLHQVVAQGPSDRLETLRDLDQLAGSALTSWRSFPEWRCHFHVPIYLENLPNLRTTQEQLLDAMNFLRATHYCKHLEIETYTWEVIPREHREKVCGGSLLGSLEREFRWTLSQLGRGDTLS